MGDGDLFEIHEDCQRLLDEVRRSRGAEVALAKEVFEETREAVRALYEAKMTNPGFSKAVNFLMGLEAFHGFHGNESAEFQLGFLRALILFAIPEEKLRCLKVEEEPAKEVEPQERVYV
jgi:hypothetical protein